MGFLPVAAGGAADAGGAVLLLGAALAFGGGAEPAELGVLRDVAEVADADGAVTPGAVLAGASLEGGSDVVGASRSFAAAGARGVLASIGGPWLVRLPSENAARPPRTPTPAASAPQSTSRRVRERAASGAESVALLAAPPVVNMPTGGGGRCAVGGIAVPLVAQGSTGEAKAPELLAA